MARLFLTVAILLVLLPLAVTSLTAIAFLILSGWEALQGTVLAPRFALEYFPWVPDNIAILRDGLLWWAATGAALSWLAAIWSRFQVSMRAVRLACGRLLLSCGLFCSLFFLLWTLALQWAGITGNSTSCSVGALLPFSDAYMHWGDAKNFLATGLWSEWLGRRPVSATLRLLTLSGGSYAGIVLVQTVACGVATWLAARSLGRRYGPWASALFFAFALVSVYPFLGSTLCETLGLTVALLCVPLFIHGMCSRSLLWLLAGSAGFWLALLCRMGAMFVLPFLGLWLLWLCRKKARQLMLVGVAFLGISLLALGYNSILHLLYTQPGSMTGGNFSYSFCGLTMGGDWRLAYDTYFPTVAEKSTAEISDFFYKKGLENLQNDPRPFFSVLGKSAMEFHQGTAGIFRNRFLPKIPKILRIAFFVGFLFFLLRTRMAGELSFYICTMAGVYFSAPLIMESDGWRVLIAAYPFFWMLGATGGITPSPSLRPVQTKTSHQEAVTSLFLLTCIILAGMTIPALAGKTAQVAPVTEILNEGETLIRGGDWLAGLAVYPDGEELPRDIPAMHFSTLMRHISTVWDKKFVSGRWPNPPFALAVSTNYTFFICPTAMLHPSPLWWKTRSKPYPGFALTLLLQAPLFEVMEAVPL